MIYKLYLQAQRVSEAIWESDWIGTPVSFQKTATFVVAAANQEFRLTAWKFVTLSNQTMVNVWQMITKCIVFKSSSFSSCFTNNVLSFSGRSADYIFSHVFTEFQEVSSRPLMILHCLNIYVNYM